MTIYAAEPDSPTAHALALLASWAATQQLSPSKPRLNPLSSRCLNPRV